MLKQGSSDPTSPRREASLFDLPGPSGPGFFCIWQAPRAALIVGSRMAIRGWRTKNDQDVHRQLLTSGMSSPCSLT